MSNDSQPFSKRISRRGVLGTAAAFAAAPAFADVCPIGPPAHEKGPRVWMDMDQIELDAAHDQSFYAPLAGQILKRYASRSKEARARLGDPKRFTYGSTRVEVLDLYPAKKSNAPIFVFIHGGAWLGENQKITVIRPNYSSMLARITSHWTLLPWSQRTATSVLWLIR